MRSRKIDAMLADDAKRLREEAKILLLGSGESGKSTVVKQMKIIHQNGFSRDELSGYRGAIIRNVIDSAHALALALRKLGLEPSSPTVGADADRIIQFNPTDVPSDVLPLSLVDAIDAFWHDQVMPQLLDRGSEYYLLDSAP